MLMMNPLYVMGIIDAEGCFYFNRNGKYNRITFNISNNDTKILHLFKEFFGFGKIYKRKGRKGSKWFIASKADLKRFVEFIEEYGPQCSEHHNPLLVKMVNRPRHGHPPTTWEEWSTAAKAYYSKPTNPYTPEQIQQFIEKAAELRKTGMYYQEIADELGVKAGTLHTWRRKYDTAYKHRPLQPRH